MVITATKTETPASQLGAAVTVVTGEEIDTRRYPTVDEALRQVPGVDIRRSGSFGKTTSISIRGANPNQVQVLVDGVRVKSSTLGQAELLKRLEHFQDKHGERFTPAPLLVEMAKSGKKFYPA